MLASIPAGLAAPTLASLGIDAGALAQAAEEVRPGAGPGLLPPAELVAEIEEVRGKKEALIEAHDFDRAAELRERERQLTQQARNAVEQRQEEVLNEVRGRLGLAQG